MKRRGWENNSKKGRDRTFSLVFNAIFLYVFLVLFIASIYLYHKRATLFGIGLESHVENLLIGALSFVGIIKQALNIYFA